MIKDESKSLSKNSEGVQIAQKHDDDLDDATNAVNNNKAGNDEVVQYPDNGGVDTEDFIRKTLIQNPKDRVFMLSVEKQLIIFLSDDK